MRNGKLLAEKPPVDLMRQHNASLLEEVVLKLCKRDADDSDMVEVKTSDARDVDIELDANRVKSSSDVSESSNQFLFAIIFLVFFYIQFCIII